MHMPYNIPNSYFSPKLTNHSIDSIGKYRQAAHGLPCAVHNGFLVALFGTYIFFRLWIFPSAKRTYFTFRSQIAPHNADISCCSLFPSMIVRKLLFRYVINIRPVHYIGENNLFSVNSSASFSSSQNLSCALSVSAV